MPGKRIFTSPFQIAVIVSAISLFGMLLHLISSLQTRENSDQLEILEAKDPRSVRHPKFPPPQPSSEASTEAKIRIKTRRRKKIVKRHKRAAPFPIISAATENTLNQQLELPLDKQSKSHGSSPWQQTEFQTSQQKVQTKSGSSRLNWVINMNVSRGDRSHTDKGTIQNNGANNTFLRTVVFVEGRNQFSESNFLRAWDALSRFLGELYSLEEFSNNNVASSRDLPESIVTGFRNSSTESDEKRNQNYDATREDSQEKATTLKSLNLVTNGGKVPGQMVGFNKSKAALGEREVLTTPAEQLENGEVNRSGRLFNWFNFRQSTSTTSASTKQKESAPSASQNAETPVITVVEQIEARNNSDGSFQRNECNNCQTEYDCSIPEETNETQNLNNCSDDSSSEVYEPITEGTLADDCECKNLRTSESQNDLGITFQDDGDSYSPNDRVEVFDCSCEDQSNFSNDMPTESEKITLPENSTTADKFVSIENETDSLAILADFCFKQILSNDKLKELSDSLNQQNNSGRKQLNSLKTYIDSLMFSKIGLGIENQLWNDSKAEDRFNDLPSNETAQIFVSLLRKRDNRPRIAKSTKWTSKFINLSEFFDFFGSGNNARMAEISDPEISFDSSSESSTVPQLVPVIETIDPKCVDFFRDILSSQDHISKPNLMDVIFLTQSELTKATASEMSLEKRLIGNKPNLKLNTHSEHPGPFDLNKITPSSEASTLNEHAITNAKQETHIGPSDKLDENSKNSLKSFSVENVKNNESKLFVDEKSKESQFFGNGRIFKGDMPETTFEDSMFVSGTDGKHNIQEQGSFEETQNRWFLGGIRGSGDGRDFVADTEKNTTVIDLGEKLSGNFSVSGNVQNMFIGSTQDDFDQETDAMHGKLFFGGDLGSGEEQDALKLDFDSTTKLVNQSEHRFFDILFGSGGGRDV